MESVKSFDECVEFCKNKLPALLIMRSFVNEPKDGLDFIRKIRMDSSISYFPIIMGWADFTYKTTEQGYQEAFEAGANACFGRVFDITEVLEEVEILFNDPTATHVMDRQTIRMQERAKSNK
jgi:DNA-binding response OmpR family regulator